MKTHSISLFLAILLISNFASARTPEEMQNDINAAAKNVVEAYNNTGMSAISSLSQKCYKKIELNQFKCLYIDMAARYIDQAGGGGSKFPAMPYFDDHQFGQRAAALFHSRRVSMDDANDYLLRMQPIVNSAVDLAFSKR